MSQQTLTDTYFGETLSSRAVKSHQDALMRCVEKLKTAMPIIGLRSPKIDRPDNLIIATRLIG